MKLDNFLGPEWVVTFTGLSVPFDPNEFGGPMTPGQKPQRLPTVIMHSAIFAMSAEGSDAKPDVFTFGC